MTEFASYEDWVVNRRVSHRVAGVEVSWKPFGNHGYDSLRKDVKAEIQELERVRETMNNLALSQRMCKVLEYVMPHIDIQPYWFKQTVKDLTAKETHRLYTLIVNSWIPR